MSGFFNSIYTLWNQILYALFNMRIIYDIIDILIIAYLIYKSIEFLRETRAGQLVKGISILLIVYLVANWFDLVSLKWLLSKVVDFAIIAVAIIFQPELRRALERVGRTKFSRGQMVNDETKAVSDCIDDVSRAAGIMQEKRIGALIVFERTTQLGDIINTGTVIDASSSVSMTNNIFFPKSPLHDGALIVREGRLYSAGCILPLTQQDNINSQLGTRHRAAIGMTENSDAIVLIVSEETGIISLAVNGTITRNYNSITVRQALRDQLLVSQNEDNDNNFMKIIKNINPFKGKNITKKEEENSDNENTDIQ